jgi:hypothetical protein
MCSGKMKRRDFIQKAGRGSILLGLVSITGFTLWKSLETDAQTCSVQPVCSGCNKLNACAKPQALKTKQNE